MMVPLPPGWLCLQDCNLTGQLNHPVVVPFVLMHPDVGVALIDVAPAANPEAETILRRRLDAARFESIFPGFLPVLYLRLDRADLPSTETILRDAFAALPPLSVPGGDGWVSMVRRALLPRDPGRAATHPGARPVERPVERPTERVQNPTRRARPEREAETDVSMLHSEATVRSTVPFGDAGAPEPSSRPPSALPWVILSGVGGLIAVLALFAVLFRDPEAPGTIDEARAPTAAVPAEPPAAATASSKPPPAPAPSPPVPGPVASAPPPAPVAPPPAVPTAPPVAAAPVRPPAPTAANGGAGASTAGSPAAPPPAQGPSQSAADQLPKITVRSPANLRVAPDAKARSLRVAPKGESFRVHGRSNGWVQVGDEEPRGYIHSSMLGNAE